MGRVAGVFDNPPGFPCTPPGVDILEGGKLTSNNVAGSSHDPLQSPAVTSGAVYKPTAKLCKGSCKLPATLFTTINHILP